MNSDAFRTLLESRREALLGERRLAESSAATVQLDQGAQGRLSRMDAMQQQAMAASQVRRPRTELRKVEAALDRPGTFGACCRCDEPMTPERLQADAATPFCQDCAHGASRE